jgi:hypothetical protein
MMLEMLFHVGAQEGRRVDARLVINDTNRHRFGCLQVRQGLSQRTRRLPAAVPSDENILETRFAPLAWWNQEKVPSRAEENVLNDVLGLLRYAVRTEGDERIG